LTIVVHQLEAMPLNEGFIEFVLVSYSFEVRLSADVMTISMTICAANLVVVEGILTTEKCTHTCGVQ
jgi:hypothetical protein